MKILTFTISLLLNYVPVNIKAKDDLNPNKVIYGVGVSPDNICEDCLDNEYNSKNECNLSCEDLLILSSIASKLNQLLRSYDNYNVTKPLIEDMNKESLALIKAELANVPGQNRQKIESALLGMLEQNKSNLFTANIDFDKPMLVFPDDEKIQKQFIILMEDYMNSIKQELAELKKNESSILYAMGSNACEKVVWNLFSKYIMGDECEEGIYFKHVKTRRNASKKLFDFYLKNLPPELDKDEKRRAIQSFTDMISHQNKVCDDAVENVSNGIQANVNAAQTIYEGILGGLMIGASGGLAAPMLSVELANLGKTMYSLGNLGMNAAGYYYAADSLKTLSNTALAFGHSNRLSLWCSLSQEALKKGGDSFPKMWRNGVITGGLGMALGGMLGSAAKSKDILVKGLAIGGTGMLIGAAGKGLVVDPIKQREKLEKLKDKYNDTAAGKRVKRCIDSAKRKVTAGQAIDISALALGLSKSPKAMKKYSGKDKKVAKTKKPQNKPKETNISLKKNVNLSDTDVKHLQQAQALMNSKEKSRIILRNADELRTKIRKKEVVPKNIFNEREVIQNLEYAEITALAKRLENKNNILKSLQRYLEDYNAYLRKNGKENTTKNFERFMVKRCYELGYPPKNLSSSNANSPENVGRVLLDVNPNGKLLSTGQSPEIYARNLKMLLALEDTVNIAGKEKAGRLFGTIQKSQQLYDELFTGVNKNLDGSISDVPKYTMSNDEYMSEIIKIIFPVTKN